MWTKDEIQTLISEAAEIAHHADTSPPHDYQSLKTGVVQKELSDEIVILQSMINSDHFEERFKERCKTRAVENADSCLSFFAMPDGACNTLYWNIACKLAPHDNLREVFGIIAPQLTHHLTHEASRKDESKPWNFSNITFHFVEEDLSSFATRPASLDTLSQLVVTDSYLLNLEDIQRFNFPLHQAYYQALKNKAPDLFAHLYQHNPAIKKLSQDLALLAPKGNGLKRCFPPLRKHFGLGAPG